MNHKLKIDTEYTPSPEEFVRLVLEKIRAYKLEKRIILQSFDFRTLVAINYTGVASFEYEIEENDPLPGLTESVAYARQVLATI